jgi:hypothetical protein
LVAEEYEEAAAVDSSFGTLDSASAELLVRMPAEARGWIGRFAENTFQFPEASAAMLLSAMRDLIAMELGHVPFTVREADCLTDLLLCSIRFGRRSLEFLMQAAANNKFDVDDVWAAVKFVGEDNLESDGFGEVRPGFGLGPIAYIEAAYAFGCNHGEDSYGTVYGVDQEVLLTKLRSLGPTADLALRLACAQMGTVWPIERRDYGTVGIKHP